MLGEIVQDKLDTFLISETKVDPFFLSSQFAIEGFSFSFRLDRNSLGGATMPFVKGRNSFKTLKLIQAKQLS